MTREIKHEDAAARLDALHRTGRIVRNTWNDRNSRGEEIACWAGAFAPDVNSIRDACRAKWCPRWFLEMLPSFDDETSDERWPEFTARYVRIIHHIPKLTPEGSDRARDRSMIASLRVALPHDKHYVVQPVIDLLERRITGEDVAAEMTAARAAAADAAWAAEVVAWAARAAADAAWAAEVVAWAARAAAWATADAEMEAARAARAAWDIIADATLSALETELEIA